MKTIKKLIGHTNLFYQFIELYKKNILPNKILFSGNKGMGKFNLINHFINYIFSQNEEFKYDLKNLIINCNNRSFLLFEKNIHPNIFLIKKNKDKKYVDISQIRDMINFQNRSSFNNNMKFIIVENVSDLNLNSSNALLKSIEEPNNNVFYLLKYNTGSFILDTIRSRCIEFKLFLNKSDHELIINEYFGENVYESISKDISNYYNDPYFTISLIKYLNDNSLDWNKVTIEDLIRLIIIKGDYIKNKFINDNVALLIELFFYKNIKVNKEITYKLKNYFYIKLNQIKKYNLDMESYFIEFKEKLLSE